MKTKVAVKYFGSKAALARALGLHKTAISQWGEDVPRLRAYEIQELTQGKLKAGKKATNA